MFNRGCDTIFTDSQQETNNHLNFMTPPIKKIFQSNEINFPQHRSCFQTPITKNNSQTTSESKSFLQICNQNPIGNLRQLAQNLFSSPKLHQKQEDEEPKPCNCKKSKCLKLYCDCFAIGKLCTSKCNCCGCFNNSSNLQERNYQMKKLIEKNPNAFDEKVQEIDDKISHTKGCNCRKSGCQKKYCECFQQGIECSDTCKCDGCKNCSNNLIKLLTFKDTQQFTKQYKEMNN